MSENIRRRGRRRSRAKKGNWFTKMKIWQRVLLCTAGVLLCFIFAGAAYVCAKWNKINTQDIQADVANSILAHYDKSVEKMLPYWAFGSNETWCMIGYHAAAVLADMICKDVKGFDYERAFEAMVTTAMNDNYDCLPEYRELGYVPFDKEAESVSKTLEYAYDDYAIAQAAKKLGKKKEYD